MPSWQGVPNKSTVKFMSILTTYQPWLFQIILSHSWQFSWWAHVCPHPQVPPAPTTSWWRGPSSPPPHTAAGQPCPPQHCCGNDKEISSFLSSKNKVRLKIVRPCRVTGMFIYKIEMWMNCTLSACIHVEKNSETLCLHGLLVFTFSHATNTQCAGELRQISRGNKNYMFGLRKHSLNALNHSQATFRTIFKSWQL